MSYFNHAFSKRFLGTGVTRSAGVESPTNPFSTGGMLSTANTTTTDLSRLSPGYFGFFSPKTWKLVTEGDLSTLGCCPLVLASSSLLTNDKIGPFAGGYKETNKSKMINPKYISKVYTSYTCVPQQSVLSVGVTPSLAVQGAVPENFLGGTVVANCPYEFLCGETYYLRVDVKGSPALRFLNHNAYQTLSAYTGCCSGVVPTAVDPTTVYLSWAKALVLNEYVNKLIAPVVYDYTGVAWYAPGTTVTYDGTNTPVTEAQWWTSSAGVDQYAASVQAAAWTTENTAGMRLFGAYVETQFGNCSFQITDFFEKEPVRILASLVDFNGDPCVFEGLCVYNDCRGIQGMGFGEQVVRDLILSESYLQNYFATDIRVREITQGSDILNSVDRASLYTRYYILHNVPRFNNPSSTFDNDQYMLEIIVPEADPLNPVGNSLLTSFLNAWLAVECANCVELEENTCERCAIVAD